MGRDHVLALAAAMIRAGEAAGLTPEIARHIGNNFSAAVVDEDAPDGVSLQHVSREELVESLHHQRRYWPATVPETDEELEELAGKIWTALVEAIR